MSDPIWKVVKVAGRAYLLNSQNEEIAVAAPDKARELERVVEMAEKGREADRQVWEFRKAEEERAFGMYKTALEYVEKAAASTEEARSALSMATGIVEIVQRERA